ncbi:MAG: CHAD domain-containing protein [Xenococcaceae cyanobacterium MO_188.B19]|nr:CHAD domain-containing protein [Xenococcaceae cyanobacterium MO_188.B19]
MNYQQTKNTLGDWAYIGISKPYKKILNHESKVLKDKNPEKLHQMTEAIDRLSNEISRFAPALNLPISASEKNLAKIAKVLGKLRDIDRLHDILTTQYQPNLPKIERKNLQSILKSLKKERKSAFKAVKSTLHSRKYVQLKIDLEAWLESPEYQKIASLKVQRTLPDLLLPQISSFLSHPGWLIGVPIHSGNIVLEQFNVQKLSSSNIKILLDLGKCAKKTYHQMELFSRFYGNLYDDYLAKITRIQEILGNVEDTTILMKFLATLSNKEPKVYIPHLVEAIEKNRLLKLQEWQDLQKYFLHERRQQELRAITQYPM